VLHAARWKYRTQNIAILEPSHNVVGLYLRNYKARIDNRKKLLNSNIFCRCLYNIAKTSAYILPAEICWRVWGIPANFKRFRVLAALLHGSLVVGVSQLRGVEQRAAPIFGRAAITLGIGPHF